MQAYALQNTLTNLGFHNEIIRYKKTNYLKQALRLLDIQVLKCVGSAKLKKGYVKIFDRKNSDTLLHRRNTFAKFIKENLKFSKPYIGRHNLEKGTSNYDGFVLGSDQVWHPMNLGGDFFTMTFIPDDKLKITYAPSFGVPVIPKSKISKYKSYLQRINKISVREISGQKIIKEIADRNAEVVVDPTLLLKKEDWDKMKGERIISEKYIVCYFLGSNKVHRDFARKLSKITGCKIVAIPHVTEYIKADKDFGDIIPAEMGPSQFINLIANAQYVCTDSFHCSVFSLIYQKSFFVFERFAKETDAMSTNTRIYSFLELFGLHTRLMLGNEKIDNELIKPIDFSSSHLILSQLREKSLVFLTNSLKSI